MVLNKTAILFLMEEKKREKFGMHTIFSRLRTMIGTKIQRLKETGKIIPLNCKHTLEDAQSMKATQRFRVLINQYPADAVIK